MKDAPTSQVPYSEIGGQTLVLNVFDFDRFGKHDQIGQVSVVLGKVDLATTIEKRAEIEAPPENRLGEVCLALRYVPNKNKLTVVVMECKNLKKMDVLGLSGEFAGRVLTESRRSLRESLPHGAEQAAGEEEDHHQDEDAQPLLQRVLQLRRDAGEDAGGPPPEECTPRRGCTCT